MKIELDKILKIKEESLKKIGEVIIREIISDAQDGVMQNNTSGHRYRSESYKKYKANSMRRFSTDKIKTYHSEEFGAKGIKYKGRGKKKVFAQTIEGRYKLTKGGKLQAYRGRSTDTQTSFVNLTLTGDMFKALKVQKVIPLGIEIGWADGNASNIGGSVSNVDKVLGNQKLGRDVVGLNEKNQEMVLFLFAKYIDDNLKEFFKSEMIIKIS